jgi:hypothetical protein
MAVTPLPALVAVVTTGGTPVTPIPGNISGGFITNPPEATLSLYVNPIDGATQTASGNTFELPPWATWNVIPGQTTATSVNSATGDDGHVFSVVYWL